MSRSARLHLKAAPTIDNVIYFAEADAVRLAGGYFEKMEAWMKAHMRKNKTDAVAIVRTNIAGQAHGWGRDEKGRLIRVEIYWPTV